MRLLWAKKGLFVPPCLVRPARPPCAASAPTPMPPFRIPTGVGTDGAPASWGHSDAGECLVALYPLLSRLRTIPAPLDQGKSLECFETQS